MDDPIFKEKYRKYKLRVKIWERDFKRTHSRVPSKYDIREAPQQIRDAYKMYYKLKTSFLEDTLNDVLAEDGFNVLDMSQSEADFSAELWSSSENMAPGTPQLPLDISALVDVSASSLISTPGSVATDDITDQPKADMIPHSGKSEDNNYQTEHHCTLNDKAWGPEVCKTSVPISDAKKEMPTKSSKVKPFSSLSAKLFKSASFSKRNPRKPLSRNNSETLAKAARQESAPGLLGSQWEQLPDLETILIQKAREQQTSVLITSNPLLAGKEEASSMQVDAGWLSRTASLNGLKGEKSERHIATSGSLTEKHSFGLSNLDVSKFVSNTKESEGKEHIDTVQSKLQTSDMPQYFLEDTVVEKTHTPIGDSDSVVSDSGGEDETQSYRHIAKRRRTLRKIDNNVQYEVSPPLKPVKTTEILNSEQNKEKRIDLDPQKTKDEIKCPPVNDDDEGFNPEEKQCKSGGKKRTTRQRSKKTVEKAEPKGISKSRPKKSGKSSDLTGKTQTGAKKTKQQPRIRDKASRSSNVDEKNSGEVEVVKKPPEIADLRYALILERAEITCAPRANLLELEKADDMAYNYINTLSTIGEAATQHENEGTPVDAKRLAARKLLEQKVASGKLNENFVTVNLRKKVFSRGKKHVSYSKYKKGQWRHKKRIAALSGPDMDMGGCDGGVLTCFTCGGVGHFAANCKIKGDTLLPLTAQLEDDPSPFPTLAEAEEMAAKSAVVVHSRNIKNLPVAANAAIYRTEDEVDGDSAGENIENQEENLSDVTDSLHFESDDELEQMNLNLAKQVSPIKSYVGHQIPEDFLKKAGFENSADGGVKVPQLGSVGALYDLNADGSVRNVTPEVLDALHMFGHTSFRKGQDRAIMRILSGLSTLVTLSTGSGKSLCYQLPAYLYSRQKRSITLVISPLVSLMEDQVTGVPHFLRAHCLHTNQTPQQRLKVMEMIAAGEVDILLVSPEAVVAGERSTGFGAILRQLPSIAFACIDEAHCVSQWSHNFRPSYLMICKVLKQNLGVKTVLGLTATATLPTRLSITKHLGITDSERGIISDTPLPDNLLLSVSKDDNKDAALLALLNSERFTNSHSIIVYCTRRDECERVASYLRTCMQDRPSEHEMTTGKRKRKRLNWAAEPYHAGMPASRRRTIQNAFMRNELRIVVATIAFGMGINKSDLRAVIHYNMPRNFESYVQEIGRAGRDGELAHCHLFLDARGGDKFELRRHVYANSIDRHVIRKLLQHVFVPCACTRQKDRRLPLLQQQSGIDGQSRDGTRICPGHEIGIAIESTVEELDIPEENISTLLCYLELDERFNIKMLSSAYITAKVISYGGAKYLKHAAKECPPLAMAIAMEIKKNKFKEDANIIEFSVVDIAAAIGWNSGIVKHQLKNLEWTQVNGYPRRSPISVSFSNLGLRVKAPGDFTAEEIDEALDMLYNRVLQQEHTQLIQLQYTFQGLSSVAYNNYKPCAGSIFSPDRSNQLKGIIRNYFQNEYPKELKLEVDSSDFSDKDIEDSVHSLINLYPDNNFSGRNIARIFHGISSPNYPAVMWGRCKYWRALSKVDFNRIVKLANAVIVRRRM